MRPQPVPPKREFTQEEINTSKERYDRIRGNDFPLNNNLTQAAGDYLTRPTRPSLGAVIQSREQWGNDPFAYGKPFSLGAGERDLDFDKYYSRKSFKKLGFSPFRDNEAVYNKNSSWLGDFGRAIPQIINLAGIGFRDMETEWGSFNKEPDVEHAAEMQRAIRMGSTTRGGLGGWITNFAVNTGYTIGVMTALVAEELALTGITAAAGGLNLPATGALGITRGAIAANKIGSFRKTLRAMADTIKAIRTPQQASTFYNAAKATGKFLNPFERTAGFIGEFSKLKGMSDYAKATRGAMALFGDIRMLNAVRSESKLEGGFAKIDGNKELLDAFYEKEKRLPNEEEAKNLNAISDRKANFATMSNLPLIYITNKIVLDGAMKGFKVLRESAAQTAAQEAAGTLGKVIAGGKLVGKYTVAGAKELLGSGLLKGTLKYTSKNLMEGLQESSQDVIQNTLSDYYKQYYDNPTLSIMKASFGRGLLSQVSAQGLDTFIQGFLMGGALGAVQKPLFTTLPQLGRKVLGDTKTAEKVFGQTYSSWKQQKEQYVNNFINTYNEIRKNPRKYVNTLNSNDENFVAQSLYNEYRKKVSDPKTTMDLKDESAFHHVYTMLENGQYNVLTELVGDLKQMNNEQLAEAFGDPGPDNLNMTPRERLDNFEKKLGVVKSLWDNHFKNYPNPVAIEDIKKSPEAFDLYNEFEMYRKIALFAHYSFERAADRSASILESASRSKPLEKASVTDFSVLYSPSDLQDHLRTLRQEIKLLKDTTDPQGRSSLKSKQERLGSLLSYQEISKALTSALKLGDPKAIEEVNQGLYGAYNNYLKTIANEYDEPLLDSKTQETFTLVRDFYANHQDRLDMARAVNVFTNPDYVKELLSRLHEVKTKLDDNQVVSATKGVREFIDRGAWNELFVQLYDMKVLIPEDQVDNIMKFTLPTRLLDATTDKFISLNSDRGLEAINLIKTFFERMKEPVSPIPPINQPTAAPVIPQVTIDQLRQVFDQENQRRKQDKEPLLQDFDYFIKNNSIALNILQGTQVISETKPAPKKVVEPAPETTPSVILPEFAGKVIFMTAGIGKTTAVTNHPEQLVDGDDLLLQFLISKGISSSTSQKSGLDFHKYLADNPDEGNGLINEFQDTVKAVTETGKTILTASKYLRPIAHLAFLSKDPIRVAKIFRDRGQKAHLTLPAAIKHVDESWLTFPGATLVDEDVFAEQILTGTIPETIPDDIQDKLDQVKTLEQLNTLEKELIKDVSKGNLDGLLAQAAVQLRRQQLITEVNYDKIHKGDILVMTDKKTFRNKGLAQVMEKTDDFFKVKRWAASSGKLSGALYTYNSSQLNDKVELIYREEMTDEDVTPPITNDSETIAKTNEKPVEDLKNKIKARKDNLTHNGEDLFDKPDC